MTDLEWRDGVPVSDRFGDPYFSFVGGLDETRHVFLDGNDLPDRFAPDFHIAELGFGTGLNAIAAWALWRETGQEGDLRFTSFEAFPIRADEMARALGAFPELGNQAGALIAAWAEGQRHILLDGLDLTVVEGDVAHSLPAWEGRADAWFLDGFSPERNPQMWTPEVLEAVAARTAPGGTVATYSAAGHVRRTLDAAGFEVSRVPGFGRKRHMTRARKV